MDYRSIIESRYNRRNWLELLHDIFGQKLEVWQQPQPVIVNQNMAKSALYVGKITLADGKSIAIYEVELTDSVVIERNRTGIRNLLCQNWKGMFDGAFMFCYRQNESVLRFSYVSESFNFTEDGTLAKESTDTKRFTYLLGEGHRSRTAIQQFETLRRSNQTLSDVTKAFSVEALSKMFFDEYKRQYENIIFFITGKRMVRLASKWEERTEGTPCTEIMNQFARFTNPEKAVRDYVKKLMGRLVFIQFLQKKGWMGCPAGDEWNDGDREFVQNLFAKTPFKDTFVDDVLEPLFNDINTRRKDDLTTNANLGSGIKIPYLNGGLFERDDFDKTDFPLPARYMKEMLDFFASYNFTIDENDPDDAEIGVDPEMLGRIFENLLEDNKDKGAFYTPKEIVHYMCRESLIAYLQTDVASDEVRESFRQFVTTHDVSLLKPADVYKVDRKLRDVKICDPAIGSGAFPMGLLRELFACRMAIEGMEQGTTPADVKKDIIQNSIYGVDIEKGAVDIARLRFWLSLILDEETPHALPNMDFKIMQGNSLLEQYEGIDLSGISLDTKTKKSKLKDENDAMDQSLALDEKDSLSNIQDLIKSYFQTENYEKKVEIRKNVDANIRNYIRTFKGCTGEIEQKIDSLPIPNDQFFLWHIYFKDVFDKGGFDIVIGNPPYVQVQTKDKILYNNYPAIEGHIDLYELFIQRGNMMLKTKGSLCYIIPNTILSNLYSKQLRKLLINEYGLNEITNFGMDVFQEQVVHTCIIRMQSGMNVEKIGIKKCIRSYFDVDCPFDYYLERSDIEETQNYTFDITLNYEERKLFKKLNKHKLLGDYCYLRQCIKTGNDQEYVTKSNETMPDPWKKTLKGKGMERYMIREDDVYLKYGNWLARNWANTDFYERPKIAIREAGKQITACIDEHNRYFLSSLYAVYPKNNYSISDLKYLLGILNSTLATFYVTKIAFDLTEGAFTKMRTNQLARLPIPYLNSSNENIIKLVDDIIKLKKHNPNADTSYLESEIDQLVYKLYDLTPEEIAIVENSTK